MTQPMQNVAPHEPWEGLVTPVSFLLTLAALATAGVALWVFWVTTTVLPKQDPGHISMWRTIATGFLVYSALSWVSVAGRSAPLRWLLGAASLGAVGFGVYALADTIQRALRSGDTEGYIAMMGIVLAGHGLVGLLYFLLASRTAPARTV